MKTKISLLTGLSLLICCASFSNVEVSGKKNRSQQVPSRVYSSPELQTLASALTSEYNKLMPGSKIDLKMLSKHEAGSITGSNLAFITDKELTVDKPGWKMVVGREVIVPIINAGNPYIKEIYEKGVSREIFAQLFKDPGKQVWGTIAEEGQNIPVHLYISTDNTVQAGIGQFIGTDNISENGIISENDEKLIAAVQNDPYAVGFCRMTSILDIKNQSMSNNIQLLPIDKNGNGKLDNMEKIYDDLNVFARGVWIGKYPKVLSNEIYAVSPVQPSSESQIAFLEWVLTDGQQYLAMNGYSELVYSEVQSKLERFSEVNENVPSADKAFSVPGLVLFIIIASVVLSIMLGAIIGFGRDKQFSLTGKAANTQNDFDEQSLMAPKGLFYDKSHTWAYMEKDGTVKIGMDDFLQHVTGPITRIEMKKPGERIKKGDLLVSVMQKGKHLNLYAPVSGTIHEINGELQDNPSLINASPYSDGWIYMIEPSNWLREISLLHMAGKYKKWLGDEMLRLKDFLAFSVQGPRNQYFNIILQDGGLLKNNLLEDFGPEIWEDFQTKFLDVYK